MRIREVKLLEDYAHVAALQERCGLGIDTFERWKSLWLDNPAYREGWPCGWVAEVNGKVAGYLGNIPLRYELGGKPLVVATGRGWAVDPRYRVYAMFLFAQYQNQAGVDLLLTTTANHNSAPLIDRLGWKRVPIGDWDRVDFWITSRQEFCSRLLEHTFPSGTRFLRAPLASALFLCDYLRRHSTYDCSEDVEVTLSDKFDESFDCFWNRLADQQRNLLLAVRNSEWLTWHFASAMRDKSIWIATVRNDAGIRAYAIFIRKNSERYGFSRMWLVDFKCLSGDEHLFLPLMKWALARCRTERIHVLEHIARTPGAKFVRQLRSRSRHLTTWSYLYQAANKDLAAELDQPVAWDPSLYDGDSTL